MVRGIFIFIFNLELAMNAHQKEILLVIHIRPGQISPNFLSVGPSHTHYLSWPGVLLGEAEIYGPRPIYYLHHLLNLCRR